MKQLFLCMIAIFSPIWGVYLGSPTLPEMPEEGIFLPENYFLSVKTGYEGDFVVSQRVESSDLSEITLQSIFQAGSITVGFINRVELYMLLGATQTKLGIAQTSFNSSWDFGGEIGIRANTPIWGDMKFGVDAKYFYGWPEFPNLQCSFERQWQIGAAFSQTFGYFTPYAGVMFSKFEMELIQNRYQLNIRNHSCFGCAVGLAISGKKGGYLDLEARFVDEYAFSVAVGLGF